VNRAWRGIIPPMTRGHRLPDVLLLLLRSGCILVALDGTAGGWLFSWPRPGDFWRTFCIICLTIVAAWLRKGPRKVHADHLSAASVLAGFMIRGGIISSPFATLAALAMLAGLAMANIERPDVDPRRGGTDG
jgi:hypothetical protein